MNNTSFLKHEHRCIVCKQPIDMKKIEREIFNTMHYQYKPELMPPLTDNDPIIVQDFGNDVSICCSKHCFCIHLGLEFYNEE